MNIRYQSVSLLIVAIMTLGVTAHAGPGTPVEVTSADPDNALQGTIELDVEVQGNGFKNGAIVRFLVTGTENPGGVVVTNVKVRGPKKLTATIDVSPDAEIVDFDIEVELLEGRKGKGTTLFRVFENTSLPDRFPSCAEFAEDLPITSDGGVFPDPVSTYCDGHAYAENHEGEPGTMQVSMNCKWNQFTVHPGGGTRRLHVDLSADPIPTAISSCVNAAGRVNVIFEDTRMGNVPDCSDTVNPDWGFDQLMRTVPLEGHLCELLPGQTITANMRFQTNLFHRKDKRDPPCKGGWRKCGTFREAIDIRYNDVNLCPSVSIMCIGSGIDGVCNSWTVSSAGPACVTHESSGEQRLMHVPFMVTVTACPGGDCSGQ